ncbi:DUF3426 domain-containing protein [Geminicoccus roseus]|uniref:DUF3426 domain-containing protein n=1 Tax=Geminicoccus roseus TaxID=404900 RepID=UPI0004017671|nr:DUF3426 domain-containing protein [Geminicoccus roseus]
MIVACPNCGAKYNIASSALGDKGRMVACSNCRHRWFVDPEREAPELPPAEPAPAPAPSNGSERNRMGEGTGVVRRGSKSTSLGWIVLLVLVAVIGGLVLTRDRIATAWPQVAGIYRAAGLSVVIDPGLEIRDVASSEVNEDGQRILVVTGEVVNTTDYAKTVPALRVALLDGERVEVASDVVAIEPEILEARATARFEKRLADVPTEARHTAVRFEDAP